MFHFVTEIMSFVPKNCILSHFTVVYPTFLEYIRNCLNFAVSVLNNNFERQNEIY